MDEGKSHGNLFLTVTIHILKADQKLDIGSIAVQEALTFQKLNRKKTEGQINYEEDDSDDSDEEITGSQIQQRVIAVHNAHKRQDTDDED